MKKLLTIFVVAALLTACEKLCPEAPDPAGTPDDISRYESPGYESVIYTYYCRNGKYRSITWERTLRCGSWYKSEYTSSCIK